MRLTNVPAEDCQDERRLPSVEDCQAAGNLREPARVTGPAPSRNSSSGDERSARTAPAGIGLEPLAVGAKDLARLLGISVATLERWEASGELGPAGIKKGGRRLWPLAEVREWVNAGMPRREIWTARNGIKGRG